MLPIIRRSIKRAMGGFIGDLPTTVDQATLIRQASDYFQLSVEQVTTHYATYRQLHIEKAYEQRFGEHKTFCFEEAFLFYLAITILQPTNVVEIGPYTGKSARRIVDMLQFLNLNTEVICFDIEDNLRYVSHDEVTFILKDVTNDFVQSVLEPIKPTLIFLDARPYWLLHNIISTFVTWSRTHPALLAIHDCSPFLYNPRMKLSKDDAGAVSSKTGVWERHVLAEVFAQSNTALDDVKTEGHHLRVFDTRHGLAMIAPWSVTNRVKDT